MIQPTNVQQPYPQQGTNAVSINIYNPQAFGSGTTTCGTSQQQVPFQYDNSFYNIPQTSAYAQPATAQTSTVYQQYMPAQNPIAPAPQVMPQSVMETPETQMLQAPAQEQTLVNAEPNQSTIPAQTYDEIQTPEIEQGISSENLINTDELISGLKSNDADTKADAINRVAAYTQESPEKALQVVSEPIMQALVDIIKEDTSNLQGPTDKQIEVAEKIAKNEKLTPEEEALAEDLSPRDKENKNRIFALYTLAMIQKLQRDELNQYIETQKQNGEEAIEPLKMSDLIGYDDVVNVIKNDSRPEVKVAAIQALQYVAEEQDKEEIENILADSLKSDDEAVKTAAQEAVAQFG